MIPEHLKRKPNSWNYEFPKYAPNWGTVSEACKKRDNYTCQVCGKFFGNAKYKLHATHIMSKAKGGKDVLGNLVTKCEDCHGNSPKHTHMRKKFKRVLP